MQSRLTLRASVCDGHIHIGARRVRRCSRVTPDWVGYTSRVRRVVRKPRLSPRPTPLHSGGLVRRRQGNKQAGKAGNVNRGRGLQATMRGQVHWVQQVEATPHPGYLLSPRLEYAPEVPVIPRPGEWTVLGQGRHGRDRRREYKYAQWPKHKRCRGLTTAIWSREPPGHFRSPPPHAARPRCGGLGRSSASSR